MSTRWLLRNSHWPTPRSPVSPSSAYARAFGIRFQSRSHAAKSYLYHDSGTVRNLRPTRPLLRTFQIGRRTLLTETIPPILVPPVVFAGLVLALWTWKCCMMVLFQDKIIYMPSMPPFARSEKLDDYTAICRPVEWEQKHIKSLDGTRIALCCGTLNPPMSVKVDEPGRNVIICYFQGNGSSTPPRLPILSNVLKSLASRTVTRGGQVQYTLLALSYRGYWTSSGRASQSGIELDAQALLSYVEGNFTGRDADEIEVVLWGQSIGSGVATTAAAKYLGHSGTKLKLSALVLETPFTSIRSMLTALYPQKWLPYRYLWPFLWNRWDAQIALRQIALSQENGPDVLILPATRDEVVPHEEADKIEQLCDDLSFTFTRKDIEGALHNEATTRRDGQEAIAEFINAVLQKR